ncbi:ExeM/NucH family extracellular endonuclease [Deinococcus altitudinis]|uniref:ExeM/NucH family extracellular endonuclease n=1 Tax=Deinococcus altitudinis TaxID=468914 RepID=UPI003891B0C5
MNTRIALFTTLSLLLAACGQSGPQTGVPATPVATAPTPVDAPVTAPVNTQPTASQPSATYEVTFQGANGNQVSASARYLGGLGTLALQNSPDTLQFDQLSSETFVTGGTRHVRATFRVTNKGTGALDGLVLVPIDTDDADTDPTNNGASVPTVGSTSFNRVSYYDGSDASSKAASITATGGKRFNASTGAVEADPNASAFLTGQDTSRLSATPPANLVVAGIKNYGWKVSDSLAVNASANVTFAVDLPADADPKNDPFRFSLVFTNAVAGPTAIHDVQGSTPSGNAVSPLNGKTVTVQGVVTAVSQGTFGTGGFYIEAPDADQDSDASTSEGLYVACDASCSAPRVGDVVRVNGTVSEINTQTVLTAATGGVTLTGTAALPTAATVTLPLASAGALEAYEGMRVRVTGVVSNNFTLGRFNTLTVADSRPYSYTQKNSPSVSGYAAYIADLQKRTVLVDDLNIGNNPPTNFGDNNQPLSASNTLRTGDSADVTGVVSYGWAGGTVSLDNKTDALGYRVLTTQQDATFTGTRPAAPVVSGNLTVAGANVLNFFTTLNGSAANSCTSNGNDSAASLKARGANDCTEYLRQLDKVVSNLAGLNADVTGLMEVQNDNTVGSQGNDYSLVTLVTALNTRLGGDVYGIVNNPNPGTDAIRVAMIYKKANVTPVGAALNDTNTINSRIPLAQVFQAAGGSKFAVVVNHLKSKGSGTGAGNTDISDGQGGSAAMREQQVVRLLDLIQNKIVAPTSAGGQGVANVIAVGDFNAYDQEPSLVNLRRGQDGAAGTADDLSDVFDSNVYSYQFDGQFGSLDHAFVTQSMKGLLSGGEKWHDNSDEPVVLDYNTEFKSNAQDTSYYDNSAYRSSDHDPLKVGFNLAALGTLGVTPSGNSAAYTGQSYTLSTPTTGTPDTLDIAWGDGSSDLGLPGSTTSFAHTYSATGPVTITVTAKRGANTATGTQNVTVTSPSIAVSTASPSSAVNNSGSTTTTNGVTVTRSGYAGNVALTTSVNGAGTPPAVTVSTQPGTGNSGTVSIDGNGASAGSYTVTVTASGTGVSDATTTFTVTVSTPVATTPGKLVISQVYGGGGNTGATYKNDFIELFNTGSTDIALSGYSVQYVSATGSFTAPSVFNLSGTVKANSYFLIQMAPGTGGTTNLPTPDSAPTNSSNTNGASIAAANGKVALSRTTSPVSGSADSNLLDFVGFGTANDKEGTAAAPAPSNTTSDFRVGNGCTDTNQNGTDFITGAPVPRNSNSPVNICN